MNDLEKFVRKHCYLVNVSHKFPNLYDIMASEEYKKLDKKLTALKIIGNKKVNIKELIKTDTVGKYNYRIYKEEEKLTEEEFKLLKEELSCEH